MHLSRRTSPRRPSFPPWILLMRSSSSYSLLLVGITFQKNPSDSLPEDASTQGTVHVRPFAVSAAVAHNVELLVDHELQERPTAAVKNIDPDEVMDRVPAVSS